MRGWGARSGTIPFRRMSPMRNFRSSPAQRRDHYQELTDKIIAALETGTAPWRRPWNPERVRRLDGAGERGDRPSLSRRQPLRPRHVAARFRVRRSALVQLPPGGLARGWQVRKGEKARPFISTRRSRSRTKRSEGEGETRRIPLLRAYLGLPRFADRRHPDPWPARRHENRSPSASRTPRSS